MIELDGTGCRQHNLCPSPLRQLAPARHVVIVNMCFKHVAQFNVALIEDEEEAINVTLRVDDKCLTFVDDDVSAIS